MRSPLYNVLKAGRAVRLRRMVDLVLIALLAGIICDWFRSDSRLIFSRPLPVFHPSSTSAR